MLRTVQLIQIGARAKRNFCWPTAAGNRARGAQRSAATGARRLILAKASVRAAEQPYRRPGPRRGPGRALYRPVSIHACGTARQSPVGALPSLLSLCQSRGFQSGIQRHPPAVAAGHWSAGGSRAGPASAALRPSLHPFGPGRACAVTDVRPASRQERRATGARPARPSSDVQRAIVTDPSQGPLISNSLQVAEGAKRPATRSQRLPPLSREACSLLARAAGGRQAKCRGLDPGEPFARATEAPRTATRRRRRPRRNAAAGPPIPQARRDQ